MLILYNGEIYSSGNESNSSAIAIENGFIMAIGTDDDVLNLARAGDEKVDLMGDFVLPGFTDAHIHLQQYALQLSKVDCETTSKSTCLERIKRKAETSKPGEWILGHGWNHNVWSDGYGTITDLESVAPDNPVFLTSKSLHAAWVNNAALNRIKTTDIFKNLKPERVQTDHNGNPTGIFFEETINYINNLIPGPSTEQLAEALLRAQEQLIKFGITTVHDFDPLLMYGIYADMQDNHQLKLNLIKHIPYGDLLEAVSEGLYTNLRKKKLIVGSIKLFADGALGTQTAHMLEPYEETTAEFGMIALTPDEILECGMQTIKNNFSLAIHAIGDRANRQVLDAYQALRKFENKTGLRKFKHRIEHVQLIHPSDQPRLAGLDIIASMQPVHIHSDIEVANKHWGERSEYAYPFNSLSCQNTRIIFGSDAPVESPNPFLGLHAAHFRKKAGGAKSQPWYGNERISLAAAINNYATDHAEILSEEFRFGKLKIGYQADLIVLARNPLHASENELLRFAPLKTMSSGEWVWQS